MTNNSNMQEKIERGDFYSALEDGLMTCLEHEKDSTQTTRLVSLLTTARTLMEQEDTPPAEGGNTAAEYALRTAEQYRQYHRSFCEVFVQELIQRHIYTAQNSEEWGRLDAQKKEWTAKLLTCANSKELKNIMRSREGVVRDIENLLVSSAYFGALQDSFDYPNSIDEFRCMFDNGTKPSWERFDMGLTTSPEY